MKKLIALLLAAVMVMSMFAACADTGSNQTDPPKTTSGNNDTTTTPKGDTTTTPVEPGEVSTDWIIEDDTSIEGHVVFAIPFKGSQGMDAMIAEFNKTYPNIEVELYVYSNNSDGQTAMRIAVQGGEIDVWSAFGLNSAYKMWENDLGLDLTDLCEEEGIDLKEQWGFDCYTYEDSIYSFPCGGLSYYIAINMDAWKEAGLDEKYNGLPTEWTWDEYLEASKLMTKVGADGQVEVYGGSDYHSTNYFMYTHCQVYGGDMYYNEDGTASFDNEAVIAAFERELKAELDDKIWYPKYSYRADNLQAQMTFCQGITASTIITNVTRFLHDTATYPDVDWITGFAPYPVEEKGQTNYMSGVSPFSHAGISSTISDDEFDACWAWLKWYSTYGVKYLVAAGHQPNWRGIEAGSAIQVIYGSEEEAEKWIDVESYNRVVGRTDLPAFAETNLTAYSEVAGSYNGYVMEAIAGEISAREAMESAAEEANAAIEDAD